MRPSQENHAISGGRQRQRSCGNLFWCWRSWIAFSRLYLYSITRADVLGGMLLGCLSGPMPMPDHGFVDEKNTASSVMIFKGKVNTAICYAKVIEPEAVEQIRRLCDYEMTRDQESGLCQMCCRKGCTIGTTMTIIDKAVPNVVGVDIGCGMYTKPRKREEMPEDLFICRALSG